MIADNAQNAFVLCSTKVKEISLKREKKNLKDIVVNIHLIKVRWNSEPLVKLLTFYAEISEFGQLDFQGIFCFAFLGEATF